LNFAAISAILYDHYKSHCMTWILSDALGVRMGWDLLNMGTACM